MRRFTKGLACLAAGFALVFAACGEDTPTGTNSGDQLTEAEIQALFNELSGAFSETNVFSVSQGAPAAAPGIAAAIDISQDLNVTVGCQAGGSVGIDGSVDGSVDEQSGAGDVQVDFRYDITDCAVPTETTTFTVNGDPYIQFTGDFAFSEGQFSVTATEQGGFRFEADDGRMGSCAIDLTFSASYTQGSTEPSSLDASVSGTVCGQAGSDLNPLLM